VADDKKSLLAKLNDFGVALVGGATALGSTALTGDPLVGVVVGSAASTTAKTGASAVLERLRETTRAKTRDAAQALFVSLAAEIAALADEEERARVVAAYTDDPERDAMLLEGYRELLALADRSLWPGLALLTADYWAKRRPIDPLFRQVISLLHASTAGDVGAQRNLIEGAIERLEPSSTIELAPGAEPCELLVYRPNPEGKGYEQFPTRKRLEPHRRAVGLLKSAGFGHDPPTGRYGGGDNSVLIAFDGQDLKALQRLARVLSACGHECDENPPQTTNPG
jgi:hypothetical protein